MHFIARLFVVITEDYIALGFLWSQINLTVSIILDCLVFTSFVMSVAEYVGDKSVSFALLLGDFHLSGQSLVVQIGSSHNTIDVFLRIRKFMLLIEVYLGGHICV